MMQWLAKVEKTADPSHDDFVDKSILSRLGENDCIILQNNKPFVDKSIYSNERNKYTSTQEI
jgi:hypothetical protein